MFESSLTPEKEIPFSPYIQLNSKNLFEQNFPVFQPVINSSTCITEKKVDRVVLKHSTQSENRSQLFKFSKTITTSKETSINQMQVNRNLFTQEKQFSKPTKNIQNSIFNKENINDLNEVRNSKNTQILKSFQLNTPSKKSTFDQIFESNSKKSSKFESEVKKSIDTDREPCHCKKSQCLKGYCPCFNAGKYCMEECHCVKCYNC